MSLITVIYARVSTDKQDAHNQTAILEQWARNRGWNLKTIYLENESAWKAGHQKELARLMADARQGKFQQVIVWALDRLSREQNNYISGIALIMNKLAGYGVKVLSHEESWTEMPTEFNPIFTAITGWMAHSESTRRSERTKAGLARAKRGGKRLGRPVGAVDKKKRKKRGGVLHHEW